MHHASTAGDASAALVHAGAAHATKEQISLTGTVGIRLAAAWKAAGTGAAPEVASVPVGACSGNPPVGPPAGTAGTEGAAPEAADTAEVVHCPAASGTVAAALCAHCWLQSLSLPCLDHHVRHFTIIRKHASCSHVIVSSDVRVPLGHSQCMTHFVRSCSGGLKHDYSCRKWSTCRSTVLIIDQRI